MAPGTPLRLVVITMSAQLPDPADDHDWAEATRLGSLMRGLEAAGHRVDALLPADASLAERLSMLEPDLIIVDAESGARDAIEHVVVATRDAPRPIVLFTEEHDPEHMREALAAGVVAYVVAGLAADRVRPVLDVAVARFEHERDLRRQLADAREQLAAKDLVAQAKQLLMQRHGIDEPQAYARMRTAAMKQRVCIARALSMEPAVLLLDEPFSALDALTRAKLQDELLKIVARTKSTVVMVTHDVDEAVLLSDRIVMMTNGPAATIGDVLRVELERPRDRVALAEDATYVHARKAVIDFLYTRHAHVEPQAA